MISTLRSLLFVPGNQEDLHKKVMRSSPDAVVFDLEDSVGAADKIVARVVTSKGINYLQDAKAQVKIMIRINQIDSKWILEDIAHTVTPDVFAVLVPKVETSKEVLEIRRNLDEIGCHSIEIIAGIESATGVCNVREIIRGGAINGIYFGAEDFVTDMGGLRRDDNLEVMVPRAQIAIEAKNAKISAIDMVVANLNDSDRFIRESLEARALGFGGKLCIHPNQVHLANEYFLPSKSEIKRAREILTAYAIGISEKKGAISYDGELIDAPLVERATALIALSEPSKSNGEA